MRRNASARTDLVEALTARVMFLSREAAETIVLGLRIAIRVMVEC